MFAKTQCDYVYGLRDAEKRCAPRKAVTLPMSMMARGVRHNAVLRNLSTQGAMVQIASSLRDVDQIGFLCGSVAVDATIMWRNQSGVGIRFAQPISARQLDEQLARSAAVESWRERRNRIRLVGGSDCGGGESGAVTSPPGKKPTGG